MTTQHDGQAEREEEHARDSLDFELDDRDEDALLEEEDPDRIYNNIRRPSAISFVDENTSYDDLTAIDWDREYSKERRRVEKIKSRGPLYWIYDNSQVWIVLVLTGIFIGFLASAIDVVSQWLAGLRFGYCSDAFYLSRQFCCLGIDPQDKCENWVFWTSTMDKSFLSYVSAYGIYIGLSILFAVAASLLVLECAPYAKRSGISEIKTMLGGFVIHGFLGLSTLATKTIGLCLVVGSGLWVGKEGPLVHVSCCCANVLTKFFAPINSNQARKRQILSAASAAGISVAFGSPIGGVLFMLEQMSLYTTHKVMWHAFVCAMVASVTLQTMNPFRTGQLVLFQVVFDRAWHKFELIPFAIVGVLGGMYGTMLVKLNMKFANWREHGIGYHRLSRLSGIFRAFPLIEVAAIAAASALVNFPDVYSRLQSSVLLSYLFEECGGDSSSPLCDVNHWFGSLVLLSLAAIIGTVLTSYSFGTAIPAGVLMPSMLVGALGGRGIGLLMQAWQEKHPSFFLFSSSCPPDGTCITPGVYSVVGAASALTGTTRLTVTSVVIMFELTGALTYVIPIMVGVMISKWVADAFDENGIYESWINFLQYPLLGKVENGTVSDVQVSEVMTLESDLSIIYGHTTLADIGNLLDSTTVRGFPIVTSQTNKSIIGYVTRRQLLTALGAAKSSSFETCSFVKQSTNDDNNHNGFDMRPWTELTPMTLSMQSPLHLAAKMVQTLGLRYIIFTDRGRITGLLTRKDVCRLLRSVDDEFGTAQVIRPSNHSRSGSDQAGLLDGHDEY